MTVEPLRIGLVPYRRGSREIPGIFHQVKTQKEGTSYKPGSGPFPECDHAGTLILDFCAPEM